jgi:hypothetical protein
MLQPGDTVEWLADIKVPLSQAGRIGQRKIVGQGIDMHSARYLLNDGRIKPVQPEPTTKAKPKRERRTSNAGKPKEKPVPRRRRKKPVGEGPQKSDSGPAVEGPR